MPCVFFFAFWNNIMKNIKDALIEINAIYHYPDYVKKHRFSIEGFTKQGYETLQKLLKTKQYKISCTLGILV